MKEILRRLYVAVIIVLLFGIWVTGFITFGSWLDNNPNSWITNFLYSSIIFIVFVGVVVGIVWFIYWLIIEPIRDIIKRKRGEE
jgi:hypothetical protein